MPSTYSGLLKIELMADGEKNNTWGQIENLQKTLLEEAIAGLESVNAAGGVDITLTSLQGASDQARNAFLKFTGLLTANINIIVPALSKEWVIWNATTGNFTLTIKTSAGTGVAVPQGYRNKLMCDGTNVIKAISVMQEIGRKTIPVSAGAFASSPSNGCGPYAATQISAGFPSLLGCSFDGSTAQYAEFKVPMPNEWDKGPIQFQVKWSANDTSTNAAVFGLEAAAINDNDPIATAYGTRVLVTDSNQSNANRSLHTVVSGDVTPNGTCQNGTMLALRFSRQPTDPADTLNGVAVVVEDLVLFYNSNAPNDA